MTVKSALPTLKNKPQWDLVRLLCTDGIKVSKNWKINKEKSRASLFVWPPVKQRMNIVDKNPAAANSIRPANILASACFHSGLIIYPFSSKRWKKQFTVHLLWKHPCVPLRAPVPQLLETFPLSSPVFSIPVTSGCSSTPSGSYWKCNDSLCLFWWGRCWGWCQWIGLKHWAIIMK